MEGGSASSQIAPAPTLYSTCSCVSCCCEAGGSAAQDHEAIDLNCGTSSSSSPPSCAFRCTCGSTCGRSRVPPADDPHYDDQLKQVNSVFSAAEAALQAFWRASIARVGMNAQSAGSEAAYSQVKTAARSQAAASIAWVLAAASVVLKEDTDEDEDNNAGVHFRYQGRAGSQYQYPEFYPMHKCNSAPGSTQNIIRRPDVQLSRSNMHGAAGSSYYKSNMNTTRSSPRWEWRPIRTSNSNNCMSNPPCAPSSSAPLNKPTSCSSTTISARVLEAPAPDNHPHTGVPSITISSLLPPLINCRISNTPYNQETLNSCKVNHKAISNSTTHNPSQSMDESLASEHESCTKAWSTPPHSEDADNNIALDILDTHEVLTKTMVEPFHVDKETSEEPLNIVDIEEDEKSKTALDPPTQEELDWGGDNTFSFINCSASSGDANCNIDSKPSQQDIELSSINTLQAGKKHKKHLKKKQRKASSMSSHL